MNDVTQLRHAIERATHAPPTRILPLVYDALRELAAANLAHEAPGQTLQAASWNHYESEPSHEMAAGRRGRG
jgi:hypothetical protein